MVEMIKENLVAERIACEHYRELIRYFADKDPTTRVMMEGILTNEEEHANDMHDLLVAHEGKPMLEEPRVGAAALAGQRQRHLFASSASRNSLRGRPPP